MNAFVIAIFAVSTQLAATKVGHAARATRDDPCLEAVTSLEMHACAVDEQRRSGRRLSMLLRRLRRRASPSERHTLAREQAAWAKAERSRCRKEAAAFEGGTILPVVMSTCLTQSTDARAEALVVRAGR